MLELKKIRENPDKIRTNIARRGNPEFLEVFNKLLGADRQWRESKQQEEKLRMSRNELTEQIKGLKANGKDISSVLAKAKLLPKKIASVQKKTTGFEGKLSILQKRVPNLLHDSVPEGLDGGGNIVVRTWGDATKPEFELQHHGALLQKKGLVDFSSAAKVSGAGFYYLKGDLALLDLALQRFAIDEITANGYKLVIPPLMMRRDPYEGVTDLADFENVMYKIDSEDLFLIATSEHPLAAMHMGQIIEEADLPLKYCGISPCFRREIGKHSIDERGLFRVHQFWKIEQFVFCKPEESWQFHEDLLANAESLIQKLELPYNVLNVCTGDIGTVASKKYDIEAWSPREGKYFEIISCSNCLSYQAARLKIRYRKGQGKELVHTLNSTALATSRIIRAIVENFQEKDGTIRVPKALWSYMNGIKEL